MINDQPQDSPLQVAHKRLANAAMRQPMDPASAAISAYVNGMLQSARLSALIAFTLEPVLNATWTAEERFESLFIKFLGEASDLLETKAAQAPRLVAANGAALKAN